MIAQTLEIDSWSGFFFQRIFSKGVSSNLKTMKSFLTRTEFRPGASPLATCRLIIASLRQRHGINTPLRHFVNTPLPHFVNAPLRQCVIAPKYICVIAPTHVCVTTWTSRCIMALTCLPVNTSSLPCANKCLRHYVHASLRYCVVTPGLRHTDCSRLHRVILSLFHSYRCYCRLRLRDANVSCILISPRY